MSCISINKQTHAKGTSINKEIHAKGTSINKEIHAKGTSINKEIHAPVSKTKISETWDLSETLRPNLKK